MKVAKQVQEALALGQPVVALESTIISHGMPYPKNVETALKVEETVRKNGAIPATIGIINGEIVVGMSPEEIEDFGKKKGIAKVSKRDLPIVVAKKLYGATTVSATMLVAKMVGIDVFVTGGIGGVHRGAEKTFDISRDLKELGEVDVAVVCSGAKAILDIPKTLEYLETEGVTVLSYKAKKFANFYSLATDGPVDYAFDSAEECAEILNAKKKLGLKGGVLISNPIPEEMALPHEYIDSIVDQAVRECEEQGIKGKDATPFLLKRIVELTGGKSLESNIALVCHNAELGAQIAYHLSQKRKQL
ncbi:MAG: pseudouridine-5'-phosphate glycosidase [Bacilli bacterium]|nr:pseudouridine-5'-phosphate glycosidase [Bacilli bacterium]